MIPITLPGKPDRPLLLSFWLALCVSAWSAATAVLLLVTGRSFWFTGAVLLLSTAMSGYFILPHVLRLYSDWNRAARKAATIAERTTLTVCYHLLVRVQGRSSGTAITVRPASAAASGWVAHPSLFRDSAGLSSSAEGKAKGGSWSGCGWKAELLRRDSATGKPWTIVLIPYLLLLRCFAPRTEQAVSGSNYTLY